MRDDIYGGLKNALERGASIEQAIRSLINAGYNDIDVRNTARYLTTGAMDTTTPNIQKTPQMPSLSQKKFRPLAGQQIKFRQGVRTKEGKGKIIALVIILLFLIGVLVLTLIFRDSIVQFLTGLF